MKQRVRMFFWFNITGKIISPSFIQEPLKEEKFKSIFNNLLPHSTAREGGICLKINAPFITISPSLLFGRMPG
jgi:hypothetical protein